MKKLILGVASIAFIAFAAPSNASFDIGSLEKTLSNVEGTVEKVASEADAKYAQLKRIEGTVCDQIQHYGPMVQLFPKVHKMFSIITGTNIVKDIENISSDAKRFIGDVDTVLTIGDALGPVEKGFTKLCTDLKGSKSDSLINDLVSTLKSACGVGANLDKAVVVLDDVAHVLKKVQELKLLDKAKAYLIANGKADIASKLGIANSAIGTVEDIDGKVGKFKGIIHTVTGVCKDVARM